MPTGVVPIGARVARLPWLGYLLKEKSGWGGVRNLPDPHANAVTAMSVVAQRVA